MAAQAELPDDCEIPPDFVPYWDAFWDLQGERGDSLAGVRPIPFRAIREYALHYGFAGGEFEELKTAIKEMDAELMAWAAEKKPAAPNDDDANAPSRVLILKR